MAEKPKKDVKPKRPTHASVPIRSAIDVDELALENRKLNEVVELLWVPEALSEKETNARIARALDLYESLDPADGLEGMLAAQMVGTHHAILDCLRRAAIRDQSYEGRDMNLKHAVKLMAIYTKQVAALDKHRGKGQQKVTVEHVHVAAGGKAIVGHVETGALMKPASPDPAAIEHQESIPVDIDPPKTKTRRGKSRKE